MQFCNFSRLITFHSNETLKCKNRRTANHTEEKVSAGKEAWLWKSRNSKHVSLSVRALPTDQRQSKYIYEAHWYRQS